MMRTALVLALLGSAAAGAQSPVLTNQGAQELFGRTVQLMESTAFAVPELARAGAPVTENARQAIASMTSLGQHAGLTYTFLTNVRAYLALTDAVAKPYPLPEAAGKQFVELRENTERIEAHFRGLLERLEARLRSPDRDNLARYAEANAKLAAPVAGRPRVVFLGDSITDGWRLNEYFPDRDFVNRGISGQITGEMLGRMKADVLDLKPAAVLILAGTNDIARGVPLRTIENNLTMMVELAQAHGIRPLLASVLPVSDYHKDKNPQFEMTRRRSPAVIRELNAWIANLCRARDYIYIDYHSAMADQGGMLRAELADDGLHPNAAGYRVMAPLALAAIDKLARPASRRRR
jgi:lysophospholipase L1-like esterase